MSWWHDGKHPIWTIAQVATVTVAALVLSYANATKFDGGEITTALGTGAAAFLVSRLRGA